MIKRWLLLTLPLLIFLSSCKSNSAHSLSLFAMDTVMDFTVYGDQADKALSDIEEIITRYDTAFSPTREDSAMLTLNQAGGGTLSPLWSHVLTQAMDYCDRTDGAFDPVLGKLTALWDKQKVPTEQELSAALSQSGHDKLTYSAGASECHLSAGAEFQLGGIVKGAASDAIYQKLVDDGVESAILSLGGNVIAFGTKPDGTPWTVGIRDPDGNASDYLGTVSVANRFVVASGDYERYFEQDGIRYHHILDPKTGVPVQNDLRSVIIVSNNGALADAYSTALFVMGSEKALDFWREQTETGEYDFDVILILRDKRIIVTEGLSSFTLSNGGYRYEMAHR